MLILTGLLWHIQLLQSWQYQYITYPRFAPGVIHILPFRASAGWQQRVNSNGFLTAFGMTVTRWKVVVIAGTMDRNPACRNGFLASLGMTVTRCTVVVIAGATD